MVSRFVDYKMVAATCTLQTRSWFCINPRERAARTARLGRLVWTVQRGIWARYSPHLDFVSVRTIKGRSIDRNSEIETAVWIWPVSYYVLSKPAGSVLGQLLSQINFFFNHFPVSSRLDPSWRRKSVQRTPCPCCWSPHPPLVHPALVVAIPHSFCPLLGCCCSRLL
jgi:hypothetical protein